MAWKRAASPSVTSNELLEILTSHTRGYYVLPAEPYNEVYPGIYIGDSTTALCVHLLKRLGVTHVLNAAWGSQRHMGLVNTSAAYYRNAQIEFMGVEALDMYAYPLFQHFHEAAEFIDQALSQNNGRVLVHCGEGISRSSTLVLAYLMIKQKMEVRDAIRKVVQHRNILPNSGFLLQLCQLNDELRSSKIAADKDAQANHQKRSFVRDTISVCRATPLPPIQSPSEKNSRSSTPNLMVTRYRPSSYKTSDHYEYWTPSLSPSTIHNHRLSEKSFRRSQSMERPILSRPSSPLSSSTSYNYLTMKPKPYQSLKSPLSSSLSSFPLSNCLMSTYLNNQKNHHRFSSIPTTIR